MIPIVLEKQPVMHFDNTKEEAIFRIEAGLDEESPVKPPKFIRRSEQTRPWTSEQDMKTIQIAWQAVLAIELNGNIKGYRTFSHHENGILFHFLKRNCAEYQLTILKACTTLFVIGKPIVCALPVDLGGTFVDLAYGQLKPHNASNRLIQAQKCRHKLFERNF